MHSPETKRQKERKEEKGGPTEKVTFKKPLKWMWKQALRCLGWGLAGHGWGEKQRSDHKSYMSHRKT